MQQQRVEVIENGSILSFKPPGFKQILDVQFPKSRLAVCKSCKKNYKTRDMCRERHRHSSEPWSTAYICATLDQSCTDSNNGYVDKPFKVQVVHRQPYSVKAGLDDETPVCFSCKKTNRTKNYCREKRKHRDLPWCTVFVMLSAGAGAGAGAPVANTANNSDNHDDVDFNNSNNHSHDHNHNHNNNHSHSIEDNRDEKKVNDHTPSIEHGTCSENGTCTEGHHHEHQSNSHFHDADSSTNKDSPSYARAQTPTDEQEKNKSLSHSDSDEEQAFSAAPVISPNSEDINKIDKSRTFLVKVSCDHISTHWLEFDGESKEQNAVSSDTKANSSIGTVNNNTTQSPLLLNPPVMPTILPPTIPPVNPSILMPSPIFPQTLQMAPQQFLMQQMQQQQMLQQQLSLQMQINQQLLQQQLSTNNNNISTGSIMPIPTFPISTIPTQSHTAEAEKSTRDDVEIGKTIDAQKEESGITIPPQMDLSLQQAAMQSQMLFQQQLWFQQQQLMATQVGIMPLTNIQQPFSPTPLPKKRKTGEQD
eukprot:CAMPEP_0184864882 /NCGR_PEP_ID=MMETSP0580-20130426/16214_1 /TAXON_ID=1118495 /ORGANISM="Dactyliosolen fragilissimus" /LENGTH=531 /DNA_ID=CAMNT_0027363821 /DNA_START=63 /DNA_END=1658 /DNA_ORIENTATION=+